VKSFLLSRGQQIPLAVAGKLSEPADAERVLQEGSADMVAIARGLLADPYWPAKVKAGQLDRIVQCDYCNVCKTMDGTHRAVICALWPKNTLQAPARDAPGATPRWTNGGAHLSATLKGARVVLSWRKAAGAEYYDVYRADEGAGGPQLVDAVKATLWTDDGVLGGRTYRYTVRPRDASGRGGPASDPLSVKSPLPDYIEQ
jgi:hypothetical protein